MIIGRVLNAQKVRADIKKALSKFVDDGKFVLVGLPESAGVTPDGVSVAQVGAAHEFGTSTIPARPWLQTGVNKAQDDISQIAVDGIKDELPQEQILNQIGVVAVGAVQQNIIEIKSPANSDRTIAQKGSANPLIDTGNMMQSVTYVMADSKPEEGI